jgi:hypothetical protein
MAFSPGWWREPPTILWDECHLCYSFLVAALPRWAVRKNKFSNGAGAITDRTLEKQAFLTIPEEVAEVIFAHRLSRLRGGPDAAPHDGHGCQRVWT